jgi:hypothetical protein
MFKSLHKTNIENSADGMATLSRRHRQAGHNFTPNGQLHPAMRALFV